MSYRIVTTAVSSLLSGTIGVDVILPITNKNAVLLQGNRAMPQLFYSFTKFEE